MQEALFNPPFWLPIALGIVGVAVFLYGNARTQTPVRNAGLGVLALTVIWCVAAFLVRTTTEQCLDRTRSIVASVERAQWPELAKLMDRNTKFTFMSMTLDAQQLVKSAQDNAERFGVKDIRIISENVERGIDTVDVTINTLVEGSMTTTAAFKFEYEQRTDGMLLSRITALRVGGASTDEISRQIGR